MQIFLDVEHSISILCIVEVRGARLPISVEETVVGPGGRDESVN